MTAARAPTGITGENAALFDAFALHVATRTPNTRDAYLRDVAQLFALADPTPMARVDRRQLMRFVGTLHGRGLSGRSLARTLSAWRAFFRFLAEHDRSLTEDPTSGIKAPKSPRRLPAALSPDEAAKLVTIEVDGALPLRDRALFELAYSTPQGFTIDEPADELGTHMCIPPHWEDRRSEISSLEPIDTLENVKS